ncbi:hypothetical protein QFC21_001777 [Naganishia friedmannii]|uniref:Uncharacterized protein n=1 Tax=Naganishia friedmannii TaxID=89922 RepID=A0ACC2W2W1_9TREE|nr:hypothetical protein QFC21_001777 [Naganishia friedmannii]
METSSEPVTWADLPDETVEHIYETLSPGDCIRLGRVDRRCQVIFKSSKVRYRWMLKAHNLVDVNPDQPPIEKLQELEARQKAWSTLTPRRTDYDFIVDGHTSIYELQEGIFLHTEGNIDWLSQLQGVKPHLLRLVPLPWVDNSLMKNVPRNTRDVGFDVADLTFDPTQDLIVISEKLKYNANERHRQPLLRYHLLTISSLEPHPLATRVPLFSNEDSPNIRNVYQLLQISGDILAVSATPAPPLAHEEILPPGMEAPSRLHMVKVWNWRTGDVLSRLVTDSSIAAFTQELSMSDSSLPPAMILLDDRRFLLVVDEGHCVHLDIYGFGKPRNDGTLPQAELLVRFSMQGYRVNTRSSLNLQSILARPDPPFPSTTMHTPLGKLKPFTEDPETGLLVLSLQFTFQADHFPMSEETVVFFLKEELLQLVNKYEAAFEEREPSKEGGVQKGDRVVEWAQWKHLTRVMEEPESGSRWVCFVHGYRYVTRVEIPSTDDDDDDEDDIDLPRPSHLQIFDFSPISIRKFEFKYRHLLGPSRDDNFVILGDYTIHYYSRNHPSRVYLEESRHCHFETNLPYLVITRTVESYEISGLMIDEARIIMSHTNDDPTARQSTFSVLTM